MTKAKFLFLACLASTPALAKDNDTVMHMCNQHNEEVLVSREAYGKLSAAEKEAANLRPGNPAYDVDPEKDSCGNSTRGPVEDFGEDGDEGRDKET